LRRIARNAVGWGAGILMSVEMAWPRKDCKPYSYGVKLDKRPALHEKFTKRSF
jgi:hypothetical protein